MSLFLFGLAGVHALSSIVAICLLRLNLVEFWTLGSALLHPPDGGHALFCMGTIDCEKNRGATKKLGKKKG